MSCLVISLLVLAIGPDDRKATPMTDVARADHRFALDLYSKLSDGAANLFFSPESISAALAMTHAGARGETAEQMARVLHLDQAPDASRPASPPIDPGGEGRGFRLSVANRLWGNDGLHILPDYLELTRVRFGAELARVDFSRTEEARRAINAWIGERTQGKIKDMIQAGNLDASTRLVLTNAIYFKGDWSVSFARGLTKDETFHHTSKDKVQVPTMHRKAEFLYFEGEGLKIVELPYGKGELAMDLFLPDQVDGLSALEARLTADNLARWLGGLQRREVEASLPRFKMTSRFDLAGVLKAMGMPLAFSPVQADFSKISSEDRLSLSGVIHQAFVQVNEEGTEAAVVTRTLARMLPKPPAVFRVDHPFFFLIRDTRTGSILFVGRVTNPTD